MAPDIFSKLDALAPTAKALNEECNAVPELFHRAEERLRELGLGIPAEVCVSRTNTTFLQGAGHNDEEEVPAVVVLYLSYEKCNGTWGFCARRRTCVESGVNSYSGDKEYNEIVEEDRPMDLSSLPRSEKVEALEKLPSLIDRIGQLANEHIEIVRAAKKSVQSESTPATVIAGTEEASVATKKPTKSRIQRK